MTTSTGFTAAISRKEWLNPAEEKLQAALHSAFKSGGENGARIKDALHGTWIGHPLHVILTDIPLGAWTSAIVFDALSVLSKNHSMDSAADASIAAGLAGAILAAVTGVTDWQDIDPPARRVGLVHGLIKQRRITSMTLRSMGVLAL